MFCEIVLFLLSDANSVLVCVNLSCAYPYGIWHTIIWRDLKFTFPILSFFGEDEISFCQHFKELLLRVAKSYIFSSVYLNFFLSSSRQNQSS